MEQGLVMVIELLKAEDGNEDMLTLLREGFKKNTDYIPSLVAEILTLSRGSGRLKKVFELLMKNCEDTVLSNAIIEAFRVVLVGCTDSIKYMTALEMAQAALKKEFYLQFLLQMVKITTSFQKYLLIEQYIHLNHPSFVKDDKISASQLTDSRK